MKYVIARFKDLVEQWYNEFLPTIAEDKSMFLEDSGIVYIKPKLSLESKKVDTIRFFVENAVKVKTNKDDCAMFIREPKPVNDIKLKQFLVEVERLDSIDDENKNKIFHLANHRYFANSSDILVSQWKEIDVFLNQVFDTLTSINSSTRGLKFYSSQSLGIEDTLGVFSSFFTRNSMILSKPYVGKSLSILPTSEILVNLSNDLGLVPKQAQSKKTSDFIEHEKQVMMSDIESLV